MKPNEIKALLAQRDIKITEMALELNVDRNAISAVINYLRKNDELRKKIARYLKIPVKQLFDEGIEVAPAKFRSRAA